MKRIDVRLAFAALRTRTGLSADGFAKLLGYGSSAELDCYEHPGGSYQHAHLPDQLIERMIENLIGEGHPAVTRDDIVQLSLAHDCLNRDLTAELVTPSLLADILVAFDAAVENNSQLKPTADVSAKARQTAILYKQLNSGLIGPSLVAEIMGRVLSTYTGHRLGEAQREAILEELVARTMLVELIEAKAQDGATVAFLRHLLDTRYAGVELRHQSSHALSSILDQIGAIAAAHEDPRIADADNVVVLRGRSR
ncbi:MAG: hypothetical protein GY948_11805 [Alphaproteobacteria bacterium]|nr:hypothetical protein [Alphaproteobacteria bacterium]